MSETVYNVQENITCAAGKIPVLRCAKPPTRLSANTKKINRAAGAKKRADALAAYDCGEDEKWSKAANKCVPKAPVKAVKNPLRQSANERRTATRKANKLRKQGVNPVAVAQNSHLHFDY